MNILNNTLEFSLELAIITFTIAMLVSYLCYPVIIKVSNLKNLMSEPNQRDVHATKTPNLGGIGIFFAIYLTVAILGNYYESDKLLNILGAMTIMFFIGLVDDLIGVSPKSKLIGQVIVAIIIIFMTNLRISSLYGILGIYELPYIVSVILTVLFYITIINAYNLIDGVDGLAGSFAITANVLFAIFFYLNSNFTMLFLSLGIIGALTSFLFFNFSKTKKIFMGDTGSMVIGMLLAYQAVNLTSVDFYETLAFIDLKSLVYILALFSFPLIDTIRVFSIRIKEGKSPFTADNNHIHHNLLAAGLKHWEISITTSLYTLSIVFVMFLCNELEIHKMLFVLSLVWFFTAIVADNLSLTVIDLELKFKQKVLRDINFKKSLLYAN